jgi:phosphatidylserine decarboxylase
MSRFFISKELFIVICALTVLFLIKLSIGSFVLWLFAYTLLLFLLRKRGSHASEIQNTEMSQFFSPVNGKVFSIEKNIELDNFEGHFHKLRFLINPINEWGIYLPFRGEIEEVRKNRGKSIGRFENKSLSFNNNDLDSVKILLKSANNHICIFNIVKCVVGFYPRVWIESGDRGKTSSCVGFVPFGGTVEVYLSNEFRLDLEVGDKVRAGSSILARIIQK